MNCFVRYIAVLDKSGEIHSVELLPGLNVITGKSSTGKSAIIEIFDYCIGNSDYTIPEGKITASTAIYFIVLEFRSLALILARRGESDSCFIKEVRAASVLEEVRTQGLDFFESQYFLRLPDFNKELGRYFGITLTSVDDESEARSPFGRKSPTPSIRSFASFMLQHQNLVANKHAIFYRFDEKEKREQAIEHFRIFLGLVDQKYFVLKQQESEMKLELRRIELLLPKKAMQRAEIEGQVQRALNEYAAISGTQLVDFSASDAAKSPQRALDYIASAPVRVDALASEFDKRISDLERARSSTLAELRRFERRRSAVKASIDYADGFRSAAVAVEVPDSVDVAMAICPFCESQVEAAENEANKLSDAIGWLNRELRLSPYMRESFIEDERELNREIQRVKAVLAHIQEEIAALDQQSVELDQKRSLSELAMKAKLRVEALLEFAISNMSADLEDKKLEIERRLKEVREDLGKYNVGPRLHEISTELEEAMREIGGRFEFEESYKPINLKFSLETFDLWHEKGDKRVFLRAMGSGANWVYCHLTLFLALHRLFAQHSNLGCKVPPILFLDQPSQVYFPNSQNDIAEVFDAEALSKGTQRQLHVDEDLLAVTHMYDELVRFTLETQKITGMLPQVIVTDHADHLNLANGESFEAFVRARWRTRGFIA